MAPPRSFKMSVVGWHAAGKTSLCRRYRGDAFQPAYQSTIMVDFDTSTEIRVGGTPVRLVVFDTAGQERFAPTVDIVLRNIRGALVVYALDDARSYDVARQYVVRLRANTGALPIVLVGSKLDLVDPDACSDTSALEGSSHDDLALNWRPPKGEPLVRYAAAAASVLAQPMAARVELRARPASYAEAGAEAYETQWRIGDESDDAASSSSFSSGSCSPTSSSVVGAAPRPAPRRAVPQLDVLRYCHEQGLGYVETSSLANTNVVSAFYVLAERMLRNEARMAPLPAAAAPLAALTLIDSAEELVQIERAISATGHRDDDGGGGGPRCAC